MFIIMWVINELEMERACFETKLFKKTTINFNKLFYLKV